LGKRRIKMTLTVVATAMSLALIGAITTPIAANAATSTGTQNSETWVLTSGGQSIESGMAQLAAVDESYRKKAQALTDTWKQRLDAGLTIAGLDQTTREGQLTEVQNIKSTLASPNLSSTSARSNTVRAAGVTAQAIDPTNPNTFQVRGVGGFQRTLLV
jgi:hypothetical protein